MKTFALMPILLTGVMLAVPIDVFAQQAPHHPARKNTARQHRPALPPRHEPPVKSGKLIDYKTILR